MPRSSIAVPRRSVQDFPYCLDVLEGTQSCSWGNTLFSSNVVSAAFWFKPRKTGSSSFDVQFGYSNSRWYFIYNGATRKIGFVKRTSNVEAGSGFLTNNLSTGEWYLIIGTYDKDAGANNITLSVYNSNGDLVESLASTTTGAIDSTAQPLKAGYDSNRSLAVNAQFQQILVYDRVLTTTEQSNLALGILPSSTNLQLYSPLTDGSGTNAADISGNNHPGTLSGSATWAINTLTKARTATTSRSLVSSQVTPALNLNRNSSGKLAFGTGLSSGTLSTISVTIWLKITQTPTSNFEVAFGYGNSRWYFIFNGATTQLRFHANIGGAEKGAGVVSALTLNQWYLVCGKYDGTNLDTKIYDTTGALVVDATAAFAGTIDATAQPLEIGHDPSRGYYCSVQTAEARIYSSLLSDSDFQNLALFKDPAGKTLIGRWKINAGSGTSITDLVASNTGTVTNGTWVSNGILPISRTSVT